VIHRLRDQSSPKNVGSVGSNIRLSVARSRVRIPERVESKEHLESEDLSQDGARPRNLAPIGTQVRRTSEGV